MRLDELGEFELIARLTAGLSTGADVVLGAGDDTAVLDLDGSDTLLLATCDAQVQGRHFLLDVATPEEIGHKALAVNLSDIAAMGGTPRWALISLLAPPALDVAVLDGIYAGMRALAGQFDVALVGGNVAATDGPLTLDITLLGKCMRGQVLRRDGARPGDVLMVSGSLGAAAAGVLAVTQPEPAGAALPEALRQRARHAMVAPQPRVTLGRALAAQGMVTAAIDISDGCAGDLGHLCERSGVGVVVEAAAVPVDAAARALAPVYGRDPLLLALTGGEDYELLCAVRPEGVARAQAIAASVGVDFTPLGRITTPDEGMRLRTADGQESALLAGGWDHLRRSTNEPSA